jgi:hypothetical protein
LHVKKRRFPRELARLPGVLYSGCKVAFHWAYRRLTKMIPAATSRNATAKAPVMGSP